MNRQRGISGGAVMNKDKKSFYPDYLFEIEAVAVLPDRPA